MKLEYVAPCLYCDEYVADTMIASCGDPCSAVGGTGASDATDPRCFRSFYDENNVYVGQYADRTWGSVGEWWYYCY